MGRVISDRRSVEYLEQEVDRLEHALHLTEKGWSDAKRKGDAALQQLKAASEREANLNSSIGELTEQAQRDAHCFNDLAGKLAAEKAKVGTLSKSLSDANETIKAQQKGNPNLQLDFVEPLGADADLVCVLVISAFYCSARGRCCASHFASNG